MVFTIGDALREAASGGSGGWWSDYLIEEQGLMRVEGGWWRSAGGKMASAESQMGQPLFVRLFVARVICGSGYLWLDLWLAHRRSGAHHLADQRTPAVPGHRTPPRLIPRRHPLWPKPPKCLQVARCSGLHSEQSSVRDCRAFANGETTISLRNWGSLPGDHFRFLSVHHSRPTAAPMAMSQ